MATTQFTDIPTHIIARHVGPLLTVKSTAALQRASKHHGGDVEIPKASDYLEAVKRLIDNDAVADLEAVIERDPAVVNLTFKHDVYVIIPDVTPLYTRLWSVTEFEGNCTGTTPRDITLADYACVKERPKCFKLLLSKGCPASIYSVQYIGRVVDFFATQGNKRYKRAVSMLIALLIKYPNIQDVRQDPEVSPNGVTYSSVFPFGSTHENDDEWEEDSTPPMLYLRIMFDHGVKRDTEPPQSFKDDYGDKMHSFNYSRAVENSIREGPPGPPTYSMVSAGTRARMARMLKGPVGVGEDMH